MTLTADQKTFRLRITGDPDGTGKREAVFELTSAEDDGLAVPHEMRTGFLARGGSSLNAILQALTDSDESQNKDFVIDGGQSQFILEPSGQLINGRPENQWGDTGNGGSATDATGDTALEKMQVFTNWLRKVPVDSLPEELAGDITGSYGPAIVEYGLHHPDGPLDPLGVAIENPQLVPRPNRVDVTLTTVEIASLGEPVDSQGNSKRGVASR